MKLSFGRCLAIALVLAVCTCGVSSKKKKNKKSKDPEPPRWKTGSGPAEKLKVMSVSEKQVLKLDCSARGRPKPKITWLKDDQKITMTNGIKKRKHSLVIKEVRPSDAGEYTCVVRNNEGRLEWTYTVDITDTKEPLVVEGPRNLTVPVGQTVTFRCRVLNDAGATIRWLKRKPVPMNFAAYSKSFDTETQFLENGADPELLIIKNVSLDDAGQYTCLTGNEWELKYNTAWLTVVPSGKSPSISLDTKTPKPKPKTQAPFYTAHPRTPQPTSPLPRRPATRVPIHHRTQPATVFNWTPLTRRITTWEPFVTRPPRRNNDGGRNGGRRRRPSKKKQTTEAPVMFDTTTVDMEYQTIRRVHTGNTGRGKNEHTGRGDKDKKNDKNVHPTLNVNGDASNSTKTDEFSTEGKISLWTIYTIVGAIAGIILLLGLIAITVALCCRKDSSGLYKSTPV